MKLYRICQVVNSAYDTFDSAIVAARNRKEAQHIMPGHILNGKYYPATLESWAPPEHVIVEYVGVAKVGTPVGKVILSSFNAG